MKKKFAKIVLVITLGLVFVAVFGLCYLRFRHPFVFQELSMLRLLVSEPNFASPDSSIDSIERLDEFATAQFDSKSIPGMAVAIVGNGAIVWSKGYGFADAAKKVPVTPDTPFMIGSVSKAVMGVALMHAVQDGKIELDQDVNRYVDFEIVNPLVPSNTGDDKRPITLRHLATHTSGIIDREWHYMNSYVTGDPQISLDQYLRNYLDKSGADYRPEGNFLANEPGAVSEYTNIGASLAAQCLHGATSLRLDDYSERNIFAPLEMHNTGWFLSKFADQTNLAVPHGLWNRPHPHYGYPTWPEGQLRTSANDLARMLAMVMNGGQLDGARILSETTVDAMLEKQTFEGLESIAGEGIFWSYTRGGLVGHNGGDVGVTTTMYFNPETNIGVVVLTNANVARAVEPVFNITRQVVLGESSSAIVESLAAD